MRSKLKKNPAEMMIALSIAALYVVALVIGFLS